MNIDKIKVAYIEGRPSSHPTHAKFAKSVNAEFHFVDFKMRWQDKNRSILYRVTSWLICAFTFPNRKKFNVFYVDNLHFMPVIMKILFLRKRKQKIVVHLGSHTLYFLYTHQFSKFNEYLHKQALRRYDALICEGKMAETLARKILGDKTPKIYTVFNGIPTEHQPSEKWMCKKLNGKNILLIANGQSGFRLWYKGLDLMIDAFDIAVKNDPELTFTIVGAWEKSFTDKLLENKSDKTKNAISFPGPTKDLWKYTQDASLYLHCARGDAFPITILIAMASGLPSIISEWTGTKEVIEQVAPVFIAPLDAKAIAEKINWYFELPLSERELFSNKFRSIAKNYTEENVIENFKSTFAQMIFDFHLHDKKTG